MFLALAVTSPALWSKSSSSIRLRAANTLVATATSNTHTLGREKTRLVEEEKKRVRDEGLSTWLRMALLWQPGSCGPHRSTAASRLSLLLHSLLLFCSVFTHLFLTPLIIRFLEVLRSPFPSSLPPFLTSFLYLPTSSFNYFCLFVISPSPLSLSLFSGREGWAPRLPTGSSSRIWRRKEVGAHFNLVACHLQSVNHPVMSMKTSTRYFYRCFQALILLQRLSWLYNAQDLIFCYLCLDDWRVMPVKWHVARGDCSPMLWISKQWVGF